MTVSATAELGAVQAHLRKNSIASEASPSGAVHFMLAFAGGCHIMASCNEKTRTLTLTRMDFLRGARIDNPEVYKFLLMASYRLDAFRLAMDPEDGEFRFTLVLGMGETPIADEEIRHALGAVLAFGNLVFVVVQRVLFGGMSADKSMAALERELDGDDAARPGREGGGSPDNAEAGRANPEPRRGPGAVPPRRSARWGQSRQPRTDADTQSGRPGPAQQADK